MVFMYKIQINKQPLLVCIPVQWAGVSRNQCLILIIPQLDQINVQRLCIILYYLKCTAQMTYDCKKFCSRIVWALWTCNCQQPVHSYERIQSVTRNTIKNRFVRVLEFPRLRYNSDWMLTVEKLNNDFVDKKSYHSNLYVHVWLQNDLMHAGTVLGGRTWESTNSLGN